MGRHPTLYFDDETLTLKAGDGTLYNVYRHHLTTKSEFFNGMLSLPIPGHPPPSLRDSTRDLLEKARKSGVDGSNDEMAVELPAQFTPTECEKFLEFVFNTNGWSPDVPRLEDLCAVLKTSDFFGCETGVEYAIHHLQNHGELGPPLRFRMGCDYHIASWVTQAFDELMTIPINDVSAEDEQILGWEAYRALAKAQAQVLDHRMSLAVCPPAASHVSWCFNHAYCAAQWENSWMSMSGVLGDLIKYELPGAVIHDKLGDYPTGAMTGDCHALTCSKVKEGVGRKSDLKKEEDIIDKALEALIKLIG
ncbi:hypothetical protein FB451DRAFT_112571 [Mycena latifolia]|nr:hypothetical protein FB451DRAFT_112571 [Mycena latifolia]